MIGPLLLIAALAAPQGAGPLPSRPPVSHLNAEEAARTTGKRVTVCGEVTSIEHSANPKDPTLFDLDAPAAAPILAVVMRASDLGRFPQLFDQLLIGRQLCLTGSVESATGRALMPLRDARQVVFVGQPPEVPDFGIHAQAVSLHAPDVTPPVVLTPVAPKYTPEAMRAKIEGSVTVLVVVDSTGKVKDTRLKTSLDPILGLDTEALRAAALWRFKPATRNGQPVNAVATIVLTFNLR